MPRPAAVLLAALLAALARGQETTDTPNRKTCIRALYQLGLQGDGSTVDSCVGCDPTRPLCAKGCRAKIDLVMAVCEGVVLPEGFSFDPNKRTVADLKWTREGKKGFMIAINRCGCSGGARAATTVAMAALVVGVLLAGG